MAIAAYPIRVSHRPRVVCSADPGTVPKVLDTITPPGLPQSAELDPSLGPVTLQGVTAP